MADEIGEVLSLGGLSNGRTIVTGMNSGHFVIITQSNTPGQEPYINLKRKCENQREPIKQESELRIGFSNEEG